MGHRLKPQDGTPYLTPTEVIGRWRDAFEFVDADNGADHVGVMLAQLRRMKVGYERHKRLPPQAAELDDVIARLEAVQAQAMNVTISEDPSDADRSCLFPVIPGEDILVGYANAQHEQVATPLVLRAAEALDYAVELV